MEFRLTQESGRTYFIRTVEVRAHDPRLIKTISEIDLMTFSQPTWSHVTLDLTLRHGRTTLLYADDLAIGSCHCVRSWDNPDEAVLFAMAIRPGWRGRGLGSRFLQGVLDGLARDGLRSVILQVDANNKAAVRIYQSRFGFEILADEVDARGERRIHMRRVLCATVANDTLGELSAG